MRAHGAPEWPVAENRKLVGVVGDENPDWKAAGHGHDPKDCLVRSIMNRNVVFCYEDESCANARKLMEESGTQFLPLVDRQMRIMGIFNRDEIRDKRHISNQQTHCDPTVKRIMVCPHDSKSVHP
jgi:CBS-domain-containing membrane protein